MQNPNTTTKIVRFILSALAFLMLTGTSYYIGALLGKHYTLKDRVASLNQAQTQVKKETLVNDGESVPSATSTFPVRQITGGKNATVPILMYHHIGDLPPVYDQIRQGLTVSTQQFEQEVAWLKEQGYQSLSLSELYAYTQNKGVLPKKPVIFTFDDGYQDALENAVPVLKKYGYTGSFAIITEWPGAIDGTNQYATWQEISKAQGEGMEIVCHTQNHFDGTSPKYNSEFIYKNLTGCQKDLQDHLGKALPFLVYPYGHYNAEYIKQAEAAGFKFGITTHEGDRIFLSNLMEIPRIRVFRQEALSRFIEILKSVKTPTITPYQNGGKATSTPVSK